MSIYGLNIKEFELLKKKEQIELDILLIKRRKQEEEKLLLMEAQIDLGQVIKETEEVPKEQPLLTAKQANFLYYNRKEGKDLPRGVIEEAVESGIITIDEMVEAFKKELKQRLE